MSNAQIRSTAALRRVLLTALAREISNFVAGSARRPCAAEVQ